MKTTFKYILTVAAAAAAGIFSSCSLDEVNPAGGITMEAYAQTVDGYETILNNAYFGMERVMFSAYRGDNGGFMGLTEADTDLWTSAGNELTDQNFFWFYAGAAPNTTYINDYWNAMYDGVGSCNLAIELASIPPFPSEAERNAKIAEARFMRAMYYYHLVEQFGGVAMLTTVLDNADNSPQRVDPMTIYREVIIPDLEYAIEWLPVGNDASMTRPVKKSALGYMAKACLQTKYYDTDEFLQKGMDAAKKLIGDAEGGGAQYGAYMYANIDDVFAEENNYTNKEALWKHRYEANSAHYGSSNGNYRLAYNQIYFTCNRTKFGACITDEASRQSWSDNVDGKFMPTQHLISLYVQEDGTLDPRFHSWFNTEWNANFEQITAATEETPADTVRYYTVTEGDAANFRKNASVVGARINKGDLAIKFIMPQDADYESELARQATAPYVIAAYKDVYDDTAHKVVDTYNGVPNQLHWFYPSLIKHNSTRYHFVRYDRVGNLNATFMMRMAEVYLIAAELDIYLNGGAQAMSYINKVRTRAGAKALTGTANIRTVLDERGRELAGEYCRFYDLKRTGMFKDSSYLQQTHPDLAQYFNPNYALRPISTTYTGTIFNGADWQNPGY